MSLSIRKYSKMMPRTRALYRYMKEEWPTFCEVCNNRWDGIVPDLMKGRLTEADVLGSGYFGIVLKTSDKRLVVKVTSDNEEGYFSQLVMDNEELRRSQGLPYYFDVFAIPEWDAFVILREDMTYGVYENGSSASPKPILRMIDSLDEYTDRVLKVDKQIAGLLRSLQEIDGYRISDGDTRLALREASGLIRVEVIKTLSKFPKISENSKYYCLSEVVRTALETYGIALSDLHPMNLGKHKHDISELVPDLPKRSKSMIALLDVGGNFGAPILDKLIAQEDVS